MQVKLVWYYGNWSLEKGLTLNTKRSNLIDYCNIQWKFVLSAAVGHSKVFEETNLEWLVLCHRSGIWGNWNQLYTSHQILFVYLQCVFCTVLAVGQSKPINFICAEILSGFFFPIIYCLLGYYWKETRGRRSLSLCKHKCFVIVDTDN